jgi:phosphoglucosamine mutase
MGIMITASHNPYRDNGLKLFGPDGMKLSDQIEKKIEKLIDARNTKQLTNPKLLGRVKRLEDGNEKYIEILKKNFPNNFHLRGIKIVLDCANGAGYKSAPKLLKELGAKVISIGIKPNGLNINDKCGSTYPFKIQSAVRRFKAHVGISFDGDADRVIMCDEKGKIIDGDQIIAMLARRWKLKKILKGGVIGTSMSNYGLENFLRKEKIKFFRSRVGDRYVKEKMRKFNFNLGGEQSGHIILGKFATTGDGLLVTLEVLFSLRKEKKASELLNVFLPVPQILENITVKDQNIIDKPKCKNAIKKASKLMKNKGRLLIRKSGTEPKIRIMGESYDKNLILKCINIIKRSIK